MQKKLSSIDVIVFIILTGYFLISNAPSMHIQDQMGLHWILLSLLNLLSGIFILKENKEILSLPIKSIFKSPITVLYAVFFILAGLSLFVAINKTEGFVIYNRLLTTVMSFSSIVLLLNRRLYLLKNFVIVIAILLLIKSYSAIAQFYSGLGKVNLNELLNSLQNSEGNKNIFAATLVVQIPFIIYGIFIHKKLFKYLCIVSLGFGIFTIVIINARASYLGLLLELILLVIGVFFIHLKNKSLKNSYKYLGLILLVFFVAFFASQKSLKKATQQDPVSIYGTFENRLSTITDTSDASTNIRLEYWQAISKAIKDKPITGLGYGNWKLYSTKYMYPYLDENVFSKHPHNDFLEIAAETGIFNSFIYFLIFVAAFVMTIRILFSNRSTDRKYISMFAFIGLSGYFIDAFFNFPLERPHMQLLFVFVVAILVLSFIDDENGSLENEKTSKLKLSIPILIILISSCTVYIHYTVLQSMKAQFIVDNDLNSVDGKPDALPNYKYDQVKAMFPAYPNIAENSEPIGLKLAKYLGKEKRYGEAFKVLDSVHNLSPNLGYDYSLKCNLYSVMGKNDSAYVYAKKAFYTKPRHFYYYRTATYLGRLSKDTTEINKMFKRYCMYRNDEVSYSFYVESLARSYYDIDKLSKIVDRGLVLYPESSLLKEFKDYVIKMKGYNVGKKQKTF
ncbi:O-antigen ligase family protein [Flavobacterium sp. MC2016-06]|uniref:O-antigen ligase family protein n=1 Tax=Flavobacterium sp. MC2016-06 TaxID=2676308 RepID=UPI0012BB1D1D|nr:O-antigen ligase family protein [Flavobacterium sp. MC2016-06]MBU3859940.1 O-antigen ligase family protein [Flavobacterium sp. MC2016-06]